MAHPSPKLVELARRIVEQEAGGSQDPAVSAAAVEAACRRLREQREQPLLAGVAVGGEPSACFIGLAESLAASTDGEATAAAATVLTHMLDLLVMLLGEELGMKPIGKLWPQETSATEIDQ
jgi:hypothetical protein